MKEPLTDYEIDYVRNWSKQVDLKDTFTFRGWKKHHASDEDAPKATKIGEKVVAALEAEPPDPRLDFIGLAKGPRKGGEIGDKSSKNHQYYVRLK
ncbi:MULTISPECIES: hypothetical protein [Marivita]|uniref:Uncharacterized protein n=1 Tax=Marivita cryptomonadis TaxID=505252 RepID=A0A9Q2NZR4_9RHOB|nr:MULTISPECIES: hypothetical protein [Marivita]MCR9168673.1 hypothetical protein [Paracoccaceae bacterium]MBM2323839.1 hypothetical protein [Marivita cryptomonadis]MBM2333428.1 hypothetical protein [Marivita cryptomonadis]MBM2343006.1 hypothetical protein [Marivita cryptomonadis]MBM2347677.1 hypothetical protein [Marivita cryptomonadis]